MTTFEPLAVATFEKVSFEQFLKDAFKLSPDDPAAETYRPIWESIKLPTRATPGSAGYDFYLPHDIEMIDGFDTTVYTGIRIKLEPGWMLAIYPRSGLGFRYGLRLKNTVGIIDSDYYNADNEGHIAIRMTADDSFSMHKGDRIAQGVITPYVIATNDVIINDNRTGGMGSTGR